MATRRSLVLLVLVWGLLAASAQAAQLFPLKTGLWFEMDKQDQLGHKWVVAIKVLEQVTLGGKQYFHLQQTNYDNTGEVEDFYVRSTDTEVYFWNGVGETLGFKLGPVGTKWSWQESNGTVYKEIVSIGPVTVPYGGTFTATCYRHYKHRNDGTDSPYDFEYLVPGGGLVKEVDYWVPQGAPYNSVLARAGQNPLFNLKGGTRLIYNSSDQKGHTWHMNQEVREQLTLNGKSYTHLRQTSYDPYQNDILSDSYIRCTDKEVYKFNGTGEDLVARAADKGASWSYAAMGGTVYTTIADIAQVTVPYGGPFVAYMHRSYFVPSGGSPSPSWDDYLVPGEAIIKTVDNWLVDSSRAPLIHVLASKLRQRGLTGLLELLLR